MRKTNNRIPIRLFSDTRNILMGFATVLVLLYHVYIRMDVISPDKWVITRSWQALTLLLYGSVDIFLFLSGMSLFYSFSKDSSLKSFYKKRAVRILPPYFIVASLWYIFTYQGITVGEYLKNLFFFNFILDGDLVFWFMALLIVLYAVYPLIHVLLTRYRGWGAVGLIIGSFLLSLAVYLLSPKLFENISPALSRMPSFLLGVMAGSLCQQGRPMPRGALPASVFLAGGIFLLTFAGAFDRMNPVIYFYTGALFNFSIMLQLALLLRRRQDGFIARLLTWLGGYSLECYLICERIYTLFEYAVDDGDPFGILYAVFVVLLTLILAKILQSVCKDFSAVLLHPAAREIQETPSGFKN